MSNESQLLLLEKVLKEHLPIILTDDKQYGILKNLVIRMRSTFENFDSQRATPYTIIDFGCGDGIAMLAIYALTAGFKNVRYIGIDVNIGKYDFIHSILTKISNNIQFVCGDACDLSLIRKHLGNDNLDYAIFRHACMSVPTYTGLMPDDKDHPAYLRTIIFNVLPFCATSDTRVFTSFYRRWEANHAQEALRLLLDNAELDERHARLQRYLNGCDQKPSLGFDKKINPPETHYFDGYVINGRVDAQKLKVLKSLDRNINTLAGLKGNRSAVVLVLFLILVYAAYNLMRKSVNVKSQLNYNGP